MRKGHDGTPRAPSTEIQDVLADLGPHVGAAARSLLVALRDAHLLQGAAAPELVEVCRDAEAKLARYRRAPSNAARSGPPPRP